MGKWQNKYNNSRQYLKKWEDQFAWLTNKDNACYCISCDSSISNMRRSSLINHEKSFKHRKNFNDPSSALFIKPDLDGLASTYLETTVQNVGDNEFENGVVHTLTPYQVRIDDYGRPSSLIDDNFDTPKNEQPESVISERRLSEVGQSFTKDLNTLIKQSPSLKKLLLGNPKFYETAAGISKLTKLLVGEMANKYLNENLMQLGDSIGNSSKDRLQSQITEVEVKILDATSQLKKLKSQLIPSEPDFEIIADEEHGPIVIHYSANDR